MEVMSGRLVTEEIEQRNLSVASAYDGPRDVQSDAFGFVSLNRAQGGSADPDPSRGCALGQAVPCPPGGDFLPSSVNHSADSNSFRYSTNQGNPKNSLIACLSDSYRYDYNMSNSLSNQRKSRRPPTAKGSVGGGPGGTGDTPSRRPPGAKSITDEQMAAVLRFLDQWVQRHCTASNGEPWSQRAIAESLGVTQAEYSSWLGDRARPGLPRIIRLREMTGATIEEILGL